MKILRAATVGLGILGGLFGAVAFLDLLVRDGGTNLAWAGLVAMAVGSAGAGMALSTPKRGGIAMLAAGLTLAGLTLATGEHDRAEVVYPVPFAAGGLLALFALRSSPTALGPARRGRGMRRGGALLATIGAALAVFFAAIALVLFFVFPDVALASLVVLPATMAGLVAAGRAGSAPAGAGRTMLWVGGLQAVVVVVLVVGNLTGLALYPDTALVGIWFAPSAALFVAGGFVTRRGDRPGPASGVDRGLDPVPSA